MIDKAILKKFNLKAVPFSAIGEGQTFNVLDDLLYEPPELPQYARRLVGDEIKWADGFYSPMISTPQSMKCKTVYVPVWRPC